MDYTERYPEQAAEFSQAKTRKDLMALRRKYIALIDAGQSPICEGAMVQFYAENLKRFRTPKTLTAEEARIRRIFQETDGTRVWARKRN